MQAYITAFAILAVPVIIAQTVRIIRLRREALEYLALSRRLCDERDRLLRDRLLLQHAN